MNNSSTNPDSQQFDGYKLSKEFEIVERLAKELLNFKDNLYEANELIIGSTKYGNNENLIAVSDLLKAEHKYFQLINASSVLKQYQDSNNNSVSETNNAERLFLSKCDSTFKSFEDTLKSFDSAHLDKTNQSIIEDYKKSLVSYQTLLQQTNQLKEEVRSNLSKLQSQTQELAPNTKQSLSTFKRLTKHIFKIDLISIIELIALSVTMCFVLTCILYWMFSFSIPFLAQWSFTNSKDFLEVDYLSTSATISAAIVASLGVFIALHQTYLNSKAEATDNLAKNVKDLTSDITLKYRILIEDITNNGLTEEFCRSSLKNILTANNCLDGEHFALTTSIHQQITNLTSKKTDPLYLSLILLKRSANLSNKTSNYFYNKEIKSCLEAGIRTIDFIANIPSSNDNVNSIINEVAAIKPLLIQHLNVQGTYKITKTNISDLIIVVNTFKSSSENNLNQINTICNDEREFFFTEIAINQQIYDFSKLLEDLEEIEQFFNQLSTSIDPTRSAIAFIHDKNRSSREILESALEVQKKAIEILAKL